MLRGRSITTVLAKCLGALVGLAIGDALGTTLEFKPRDTYPEPTDLDGGGPFNLQPGQWTAYTAIAMAMAMAMAMALALADSPSNVEH